MARSRTPKFDASEVITNEIIRIIERGVRPWRKPWTAGGSSRPLRHNGEAYQGVNNFLLTMRTLMAGYSSPFWMTIPQANGLDAKVRKGEKSSAVVYYGQSRRQARPIPDHLCAERQLHRSDRPERAAVERGGSTVLYRWTGVWRREEPGQPTETRRAGEGRRTRRGGGTDSQAPALN